MGGSRFGDCGLARISYQLFNCAAIAPDLAALGMVDALAGKAELEFEPAPLVIGQREEIGGREPTHLLLLTALVDTPSPFSGLCDSDANRHALLVTFFEQHVGDLDRLESYLQGQIPHGSRVIRLVPRHRAQLYGASEDCG